MLRLGVATFRFKFLLIFNSCWVPKQTDQSLLRNSKALGLTAVMWHDFLLKISNRYHQLPPQQLTGGVFVVARPSSPVKDPAGADRDRQGHGKEPFTIWGCTASTKALVSARCWSRRRGRPNLLLCGGATAGYVALKTWPSPLDLILALVYGGGGGWGGWACTHSCPSIGNGIDYCSWTWSCVCDCVLAILLAKTNARSAVMRTIWMLYRSVEYFEWLMLM